MARRQASSWSNGYGLKLPATSLCHSWLKSQCGFGLRDLEVTVLTGTQGVRAKYLAMSLVSPFSAASWIVTASIDS